MEWISVEDRLPQERRTHLFTNGDVIRVGYIENGQIVTFAGLHSWQEEYTYDLISEATHWMPLPDHP